MKKSEYLDRECELLREDPPPPTGWCGEEEILMVAKQHAFAAERAGVVWDPEEPEVLWEGGEYRLLADGTWEAAGSRRGHKLADWEVASLKSYCAPVFRELARRLLEEHKQQKALDDHNDKLGAEVGSLELHLDQRIADHGDRLDRLESNVYSGAEAIRAIRTALNEHRDRLDAFDRRLGSVKADWRNHLSILGGFLDRLRNLEQDLRLVRGQAAHVDEREAADFEATRIHLDGLDERVKSLETWREMRKRSLEDIGFVTVDGSLDYDKLLAVWRLWGPGGAMREKFACFDTSEPVTGSDLRQLRSELLALPDEVKS